jgi:hypothetical protein
MASSDDLRSKWAHDNEVWRQIFEEVGDSYYSLSEEEYREIKEYAWAHPNEEVPPELTLAILRRRPGIRFRNWLRRFGRRIRDFDLRSTLLGARKQELGSQARPGQAVGECSTGCPQPKPRQHLLSPWYSPQCAHTALVIRCKHHPFRDFELWLPPDPKQPSNELYTPRFEVVGGFAGVPDVITCRAVISKGPCQGHHLRVFDLNPHLRTDAGDDVEVQSNYELRFKARSHDLRSAVLLHPLAHLWPANPPTRCYAITTDTCDRRLAANVVVYPDIQWSAKLEIGFRELKDDERQTFTDMGAKRVVDRSYQISGSLDVKVDDDSIKLAPALKKFTDEAFRCINMGQWVADGIAPRLRQFGGAKITLNLPVLKLGGDWGWKEVPKSPRCGFFYGVSLKADPQLLGASGTFDVTTFVFNLLGPVGTAINQFRYRLADVDPDNSLKFALEATAGGKISGGFDYKKEVGAAEGTFSGSITGTVTLQVEAVAKGECEIKALFFSAGAGVKAGGKAEFIPTAEAGIDARGLFFKFYLDFTGLKLYMAAAFTGIKKIKQADRRRYFKIGGETPQAPSYEEIPKHEVRQKDLEGEIKSEWLILAPERWGGKGKHYLIENVVGPAAGPSAPPGAAPPDMAPQAMGAG